MRGDIVSPPADVAVIIPAHNALPDVLEAVESALAQQPAPAEVIVIDDASTDGTGDAVRARFGARVVLVSGRFGGAGAARNAGWRAARARSRLRASARPRPSSGASGLPTTCGRPSRNSGTRRASSTRPALRCEPRSRSRERTSGVRPASSSWRISPGRPACPTRHSCTRRGPHGVRGPGGARGDPHAWEDAGVADSALAVYKRMIEVLPPMGDLAARARLDRARLLDRMEHWEAGRAELRALAMMQPTHPCGEAALVEIVRHHVREREAVFAAVEAKHAMTTFDQMLATQRDPGVRLEIMMSRAEVLALMGHREDAQREYAAAARLPAASLAGWRAARLADSALSDPVAARGLYHELAGRATNLEVRWQARVRLHGADSSRSVP